MSLVKVNLIKYLKDISENIKNEVDLSYPEKEITQNGLKIKINSLDFKYAAKAINKISGLFLGLQKFLESISADNSKSGIQARSIYSEWNPESEEEDKSNIKIDLILFLNIIIKKSQDTIKFANEGDSFNDKIHGVIQKVNGFNQSIQSFIESIECN